jgi:hypothetical protein
MIFSRRRDFLFDVLTDQDAAAVEEVYAVADSFSWPFGTKR